MHLLKQFKWVFELRVQYCSIVVWECSIVEKSFRNYLRPIRRLYGVLLQNKSAKYYFKILPPDKDSLQYCSLSLTTMFSQTLPLIMIK